MEKAEDIGTSSIADDAAHGVPPEAYHITGTKKRLAALGLGLVLFISALDNSIVAVALPAIGDDLQDYQTTSWVVTAYFLTYTAFLPILSKLTDIVGRRPVLVGSSIFFALWSGACGGAKTMTQLIVFRALQGVGASAIYSGVLLTISTMVPKHELPTFGSLIGAVFSVSSVAGPIVGGVIVQGAHWGWIFFINLPIAVIGSLLIWFTVHDPQVGTPSLKEVVTRLDWFGSLAILAFSLLLCTPLQLGGTEGYPWSSAPILAPLVLAFAVLPVFLWVESRHSEPVIPLRLFRIRNTGIGILITMCIGAGFFLVCLLLPQRMQLVNAQRPIMAGVRMLPLLAVTGLVSALAGISVKLLQTFRPQLWIGLPLGAIGAGLLASLKVDSSFAPQYGFQALTGVSFGISIVLSTVAIQFSSDRRDLASAMGAQSFVRQIGGLVAVAIGTALINSRVNEAITNEGLPKQILVTPEQVLKRLPPDVLAVARNAYSTGFSRSFMVAAAWFVLGSVLSLGLVHQMPDDFLKSATANDLETASESVTVENEGDGPATPKRDA